MIATDDVVTDTVLRYDVFGMRTDDEWPDGYDRGVITVCDGEWRRRPDNRWQYYRDDADEQ
jgi:hypothetical protein